MRLRSLSPLGLATLLATALACSPPHAEPADSGAPRAALSAEDEALLRAIESLSWVPDGPDRERHAYVISAPWCGYCQRLYRRTRDLEGVQLRWIKTDARSPEHETQIAAASLSRDTAALDAIYLGEGELPEITNPAAADRIVKIHDAAMQALIRDLELRSGVRFGYPTLVYAAADGIRIEPASSEPAEQLAAVAARPEAKSVEPAAYRLAFADLAGEPIAGVVVATAGGADIRVIPDRSAPRIVRLEPDQGVRAAGKVALGGDVWYAATVYRSGEVGYVLASETELRAP
jgi:hypothetical protein